MMTELHSKCLIKRRTVTPKTRGTTQKLEQCHDQGSDRGIDWLYARF